MAQTTNTAPARLRADGVLEDWLELQSFRAPCPDPDGEVLRTISALCTAGAPETEVISAVKQARRNGWSWTAIARVLGTTRHKTIERFSRSIGHPVTARVPRQLRRCG